MNKIDRSNPNVPLRFLNEDENRKLGLGHTKYSRIYMVIVNDMMVTYNTMTDEVLTYNFEHAFKELSVEEQWEVLTGFKLDKFEQYYKRLNGCPKRCKYCGNTHLITTPGYIGEDVVSCSDCRRILWTQEVTESMLR